MSFVTAVRGRTSAVTIGIVLALAAVLSFATALFIGKQLVDDGSPVAVIAFYEVAFGLTFLAAARARSPRAGLMLGRGALGWTAAAGLCFAVAYTSFYAAMSRIDFSVGAPIIGAVPLVSYVFVLLVLRGTERLTVRSVLGATLVVGGVGLIGVTS